MPREWCRAIKTPIAYYKVAHDFTSVVSAITNSLIIAIFFVSNTLIEGRPPGHLYWEKRYTTQQKSLYTFTQMCIIHQPYGRWATLIRCYSITRGAQPLALLSNTGWITYIIRYHNNICSRLYHTSWILLCLMGAILRKKVDCITMTS